MNEMIERVAEAIYNNWANYPNCDASKSWLVVCEKLPMQAGDFRRKAKAAIKAMREPTEEMENAGRDVGPDRDPTEYYQAMIDKALE